MESLVWTPDFKNFATSSPSRKLCYRRRTARCAVSHNLVNCFTAARKSRTTNRELIEVMELEGYSRPMCNKLCASSNDASIVVGVIHKLDRRQFCRPHERLDEAKFLKSGVRQSIRGKYPYFQRYPNVLITQCRICRRELPRQKQLDSFSRFDRTPTCDGHRRTRCQDIYRNGTT